MRLKTGMVKCNYRGDGDADEVIYDADDEAALYIGQLQPIGAYSTRHLSKKKKDY